MSTGRALKSHPPLYAEGGGAPNRPEGPTTGLGPRLVVRRSIVRRPREQVAQMHLDERGDLIHGDVSTELLGQRGHSGVGDAAGHERVVPAEVDVAVECEAVHGHAAADPNPEGRDLAAGDTGTGHAEIAAGPDERLLEPSYIVDDPDVVGQAHDRISHQLTWTVKGDLPAAVHVDDRRPDDVTSRPLVWLGPFACRVDRWVLEQQHSARAPRHNRVVHLALQVPGRDIVDRGCTEADHVEGQVAHPDETNAVSVGGPGRP